MTFSTGPDGWRIVPGAPETGPTIAFFGGSFTMGTGVDDDEVFPAVLQAEHWTDHRIRNLGCHGYGTTQLLLLLRDEFGAGRQIHMAVYCWIDIHLARNYRRETWLRMLAGSGARNPHFELEDGKLVHHGVVGMEAALPAVDPNTVENEFRITRAVLGEVKKLCDEHRTKFVVVLLPWRIAKPVDIINQRVVGFCAEFGIPCLNLSRHLPLADSSNYFEHDGHPVPSWHRRVAALIARQIDPATGQVAPR